MDKKEVLLAERTTHLAEKRTQLSYERTILSYIRTAATVILFGIAFLGLSKMGGDFFNSAGLVSIVVGSLFLLFATISAFKHFHEINKIVHFFEKVIAFRFNKYKHKNK